MKQNKKTEKQSKIENEKLVSEPLEDTAKPSDDGYDGYYDDVLPVDENAERQGLDKTMIKNIAIIVAGVIVAISICVAAMYFM